MSTGNRLRNWCCIRRAINQLGRAAGAAYRGIRGTIAPEAQQAIQFANAADVPLHTTDVLQPNSRVGRMAQTTAENIPFAGTSTMRANQQEARSQLVDEFASRFGEYDPSIVIGSLKAKHQEFGKQQEPS